MWENDPAARALLPAPSLAAAATADGKAMPPLIDTEQYGYDNVAVVLAMDVQVVISVMNTSVERHSGKVGCIAVAFRGTDNLSNAVQDVRIGHVEWSEMRQESNVITNTTKVLQPRVHSGFLEVWDAMRDAVLGKVRDLRRQNPLARLLITGHSLGGAIATFCAYELQKDCVLHKEDHSSSAPGLFSSHRIDSGASLVAGSGGNVSPLLGPAGTPVGLSPPVVFTFGMPRVGNTQFRDVFNKRVRHFFRVVNESDAVSRLSIMGGAHVGIEVDIDRHGNYIIEPMFIERMFRPTKGRGNAIRHHSMFGYAESLNTIVSRTGLGVCPSSALRPYVLRDPPPPPPPANHDGDDDNGAAALDAVASLAYAPTPRTRANTAQPGPSSGGGNSPHQPPSPLLP